MLRSRLQNRRVPCSQPDSTVPSMCPWCTPNLTSSDKRPPVDVPGKFGEEEESSGVSSTSDYGSKLWCLSQFFSFCIKTELNNTKLPRKQFFTCPSF
ncbi:hypothetical protein AVEN_185551-1 [Araneus ventricosus]|uniref:Uncharacterized protein n=1 Tax=Araneus ventricosus TaxID=182803 RepID=A0A4Y2HD24_ARAVE|nr:hypothetical protein AVEN_185551-1 [Araneus ventricosus]